MALLVLLVLLLLGLRDRVLNVRETAELLRTFQTLTPTARCFAN